MELKKLTNKMKQHRTILYYSLLFFSIGLAIGAYIQADTDIQFISTVLNNSADKNTLITDGSNNFYFVERYIPEVDNNLSYFPFEIIED